MGLAGEIRTLAVAAALSVALIAALAPSAEAPDVAPADRQAAHGDHSVQLAGEPSGSGGSAAAALPRIRGTVGPGMTITINRHRVTPGRYRLVVTDESSAHNWHISGRRVDKSTSITDTGKWVWRVRLRAGRYTIVCDAHPTTMRTRLRVVAD